MFHYKVYLQAAMAENIKSNIFVVHHHQSYI